MASGPNNMQNLNVPGGSGRSNFFLYWLQQQGKDNKGVNPNQARGLSKTDWENMTKYERERVSMRDQERANAFQNQDELAARGTAYGMAAEGQTHGFNMEGHEHAARVAEEQFKRLNPAQAAAEEAKANNIKRLAADEEAARAQPTPGPSDGGDYEAGKAPWLSKGPPSKDAPAAPGGAQEAPKAPTAPPDRAPSYRDFAGGDYPDTIITGKNTYSVGGGSSSALFATPLEEKRRSYGGPATPGGRRGRGEKPGNPDAPTKGPDEPTVGELEPTGDTPNGGEGGGTTDKETEAPKEKPNFTFEGATRPFYEPAPSAPGEAKTAWRNRVLNPEQLAQAEEQWAGFRGAQVESVGEKNWSDDDEAHAKDTYVKQMFPLPEDAPKGPPRFESWRPSSPSFMNAGPHAGRWKAERGGPAKPKVDPNAKPEPEPETGKVEEPVKKDEGPLDMGARITDSGALAGEDPANDPANKGKKSKKVKTEDAPAVTEEPAPTEDAAPAGPPGPEAVKLKKDQKPAGAAQRQEWINNA